MVGAPPPPREESAELQLLRARLSGTNINPDSLLATDYLNHFNEIIMMIELVPDMPEMLDDAKCWKPLSYTEHFRQSQFAERDLAIEAYGMIAAPRREQFELVIRQTHACVAEALVGFDEIVAAGGDDSRRRNLAMEVTRKLHQYVDGISVMIHGGMTALDQPYIDGIFGSGGSAPTVAAQDDIDALFADAPARATSSQDDIDALFK
jgi:hypothetical protein